MKKIIFICVLLCVISLSLHIEPCSAKGALDREVITVSNVKELILALGSDRIIVMRPGNYILTDFDPYKKGAKSELISEVNERAFDNGVFWKEVYDGGEMVLAGVSNLTIRGSLKSDGTPGSSITVDPRYSFVLRFTNSSNISLENLYAGHSEGSFCEGGVFSFRECEKIKLTNMDMYGCGTDGLHLEDVADVSVVKSAIYSCTNSIMTVINSEKLLFSECLFYNNQGILIRMENAKNVTLDKCHINENRGQMFAVDERSKNVIVKKTAFADNNEAMIEYSRNVKFVDCSVK